MPLPLQRGVEAEDEWTRGTCQCSPTCTAPCGIGWRFAYGHKPKTQPTEGRRRRRLPAQKEMGLPDVLARLARDRDTWTAECNRLDDELGKARAVLNKTQEAYDAAVEKQGEAIAAIAAVSAMLPPETSAVQ